MLKILCFNEITSTVRYRYFSLRWIQHTCNRNRYYMLSTKNNILDMIWVCHFQTSYATSVFFSWLNFTVYFLCDFKTSIFYKTTKNFIFWADMLRSIHKMLKFPVTAAVSHSRSLRPPYQTGRAQLAICCSRYCACSLLCAILSLCILEHNAYGWANTANKNRKEVLYGMNRWGTEPGRVAERETRQA